MVYRIHSGCTGCTACARQCPTRAIRGQPGARHVIDAALCVDCGVCGWICPVPSTVSNPSGAFVPRLPRALRPAPRVDRETCNGCGACVDVCPFGSLAREGDAFRGWVHLAHPETCVRCGLCEDLCIKRAIRSEPSHEERDG